MPPRHTLEANIALPHRYRDDEPPRFANQAAPDVVIAFRSVTLHARCCCTRSATTRDTSLMAVFALWSAPRSRSTAFFRSMLERGDLLALHEPLEGLLYIGGLEVEAHGFESPKSLLAWLLDGTTSSVFLKETVNRAVLDLACVDRRFLAEVHHAFLIRRPEEIAASWYALEADMRIQETGIQALHELYIAVHDASGHPPVVIDSDDLVTRPDATMRTYCAAVGLPFVAGAMSWDAGSRAEWERTARWHEDASASTGFIARRQADRHSLESHSEVRRFADRHRPFYEQLRSHRIRLDPPAGSM